MKVSELSDNELSRLIAESIEPKPDYSRVPDNRPEMWEWREMLEDVYGWKARDMVTDPSMTMMLMERGKMHVMYSKWPTGLGEQMRETGWLATSGGPWQGRSDRLGRAVAEAYAVAFNLNRAKATGHDVP